ncbi:c-type cytochrome [Halpernia sp.]|uniref:c-type cytochrome n=1 Tax=Halpernia sp. TaxID=2782209 RepID=UPI003A8D7C19
MNKIKFLSFATVAMMLMSCGGDKKTDETTETATKTESTTPEATVNTPPTTADAGNYDPNRGLGKHENVDVSSFDPKMAAAGKAIAEVKCTSCHKPTDEKLVGPGWKGITKRHPAAWIMNFITNPDPMIDVDPELKKQLELCLVRMPNQNLADNEAREILEYMRQIDGAK